MFAAVIDAVRQAGDRDDWARLVGRKADVDGKLVHDAANVATLLSNQSAVTARVNLNLPGNLLLLGEGERKRERERERERDEASRNESEQQQQKKKTLPNQHHEQILTVT